MLVELGIAAPQPFQRHRRVFLFLVAIVFEDGAQFGVGGGLGALVVPVDGLRFFHEGNDRAMAIYDLGAEFGRVFVQDSLAMCALTLASRGSSFRACAVTACADWQRDNSEERTATGRAFKGLSEHLAEGTVRALGCLLTASALLAGCASVPMAGPGADAEGKRYDPPAPGYAVLYLYRNSLLGSEVAFSLADNQQPIGSLAEKTWIRVEVAPGQHVITCSAPSYAPLTQTPAQAAYGQHRSRRDTLSRGRRWPGLPLNPRCTAAGVSADKGRAGVAGEQPGDSVALEAAVSVERRLTLR